MNYFLSLTCLLFCLTVVFLSGCKTAGSEPSEEPVDTRILVKQSFDSLDLKIASTNFNMKRAMLIKGQMEKEQDPAVRLAMGNAFASELLKAGETQGSINVYQGMMDYINQYKISLDPQSKRNLYSQMAIAFMRHGEIENCIQNHNHQSCFIPIAGDGVHTLQSGSRNAIKIYEQSLSEFPEDLETRYLLNLAYMTLGEYPHKVPSAYRIDPSWFTNKVKIQPFRDIAPQLGINRQNLAGGTVVDDFTNDGWLDIIVTSWAPHEELTFYVNNGNGTFTDETKAYKLDGQVGCLNVNQTDFNNDGWLDLFLMRGAWYMTEGDIPSTLLMNTGKGYFEDVTMPSGITHTAPSQASAWADFNLDGWLDLVIGNESLPNFQRGIDFYINQKDGTFKHESVAYGLTINQYLKGCVAADVNNDKYPDIYFSSLTDGNFLYINKIAENKGFQTEGTDLKLREPMRSFPSFNFDFDNDGDEDLFVSAFSNEGTPALHWMESKMGKVNHALLPKLFQNNGNMQFEDVGLQMGLNEPVFTMGCNFGDINTDGFLDFYLGTGNPLYQSLVPNKMYLNIDGKRFEDVSYSGGFANIQKGHGVGFGDIDHDGDEDIYIVMGGAYDGDGFYNCLFENPNEHNNNWVVLQLEGVTANKAAIGARVELIVQENGAERKIYRTVTSGASFGANSLALEVGLRKASSIEKVSVQWPCKNCPDQEFTGLNINKAYRLVQGETNPVMLDYGKAIMQQPAHHNHH